VNEIDRQQRRAMATYSSQLRRGVIDRRQFLKLSAMAGFGFTSLRFLAGCAPRATPAPTAAQVSATVGPTSAAVAGTAQHQFLKEVGGKYRGTTLTVVSESTPPSRAIVEIARTEFMPLTGIDLRWEQLPLDQVLARLGRDTAGGLGATDVYYWDQAWIARFIDDATPPEAMLAKADLAYPGYHFGDFLKPLVEHVATYKGVLGALPYDIPIFITMYRKDVFDELGLKPPATWDAYLAAARAIDEAKAPRMRGTLGQWKSGHYALECDMTMYLWAHGGSVYAADGRATIDDDRAQAAMEYMMRVGKHMPAEAVTWDWSGEAQAFAQGRAGFYTSWGEFFPSFDDPATSRIVGLAEPLEVPAAIGLRKRSECGFEETPGVSHQGGSSLALSRYSKNQDAAWIFMQWATSSDITTRASLLGGGATPTRKSTFSDPRIRANNKVVAGSTRHFDVTLDAIMNWMGTEPHHPGWAALSVDSFAMELGKMTTRQQGIKTTLDNMAKAANAAAARASIRT
jgi:multiple sugar transport system substrate-binding protein